MMNTKTSLFLTSLFVFLSLNLLISGDIYDSALCPDPPINDDPCNLSANPPFDLSAVGAHSGTTCCARGSQDMNTDGSPADYPNVSCNAQTEQAAVWYVYTPDPSEEGYIVNIEGTVEPMAVEVYWATSDDVCNGDLGETIAASCVSKSVEFRISNCPTSEQLLYIKVGSKSDECTDFNISVVTGVNDLSADECIDAMELFPVTEEQFQIDYFCVSGSLDFACPEVDTIGGCKQLVNMPAVWYKITTDELATQMFTTVESEGNWDPVWSIYEGPSCDDLRVVDLGGVPPCSDGDNTPELHQIGVTNSGTYWIAITADPNSIPDGGIENAGFELCLVTTITALICLGNEVGDCADPSLNIEVIERESGGGNLVGPFCQGEEVTVNISFFYDASESGADWLAGFVPKFGSGWDMSDFDYNENAPTANGITGQWYVSGSALGPIIQEPVPILCTYIDADGNLQICNQLCDPCTECEQSGMQEGDLLPSGYFWVTNGNNAACDNDGSPGEGWGVGSILAQIDWTFSLKVKEFSNEQECIDNRDLSISFQTFSDGVAGCWEDPQGECILDRMMFGPNWRVGCSELPPGVNEIDDVTICSGETLNIPVSVLDGSNVDVVVIAQNSSTILGEDDYQFENGSGTISDQLINLVADTSIQIYEVFSQDSAFLCNGPKSVFSVTVLPPREVDIVDKVCECIGGCTTLVVESGNTYLWSTGETANSITVCPDEVLTVDLEVTYEDGCVGSASILVDCEGSTPQCMQSEEFKVQYDFYIDENRNGIRDTLEVSIGDGSLIVAPEGTVVYNTSIGRSDLFLDEGDYTIIYNSDHLENWYLTSLDSVDVMLDTANNCMLVEFGLTNDEVIRGFDLTYALNVRCNSDRYFYLFMKNEGNVPESGIVWVEMDEEIIQDDYFDVNMVDTLILPNKIGWFYQDVLPGTTVSIKSLVHIPGPPDFPIGGLITNRMYLEINNLDGSTTIVEDQEHSRTVLCSYDPNDKAVDPFHPLGYTDIEEDELTFKIRFQNTGNAPAENIIILDTLSEHVQLETVRYVGGSHDEYLSFSRSDDRVLSFNFNNIYLPDSTSDVEGSQGFLVYKVKVNESLPEGAQIDNTAYIYFDNNPAIVTNTTKNILYDDADDDGYFSIEDCDEEDPAINPGAEEIVNNGVDEDCDGTAVIIDNDMDGFNSDEDCDDEDPAINPDADEIINNNVDENCDGLAVVIDNDNDGFNSDEDCDDDNPDINPDGEEIPNNGIDEDCDGEDLIINSTLDLDPFSVEISPNPTKDNVTIKVETRVRGLNYQIVNASGQMVDRGPMNTKSVTLDLSSLPKGLYLILIGNDLSSKYSFHKVVKM